MENKMPEIVYSTKPFGYKKYDVIIDYITAGDCWPKHCPEDEKDYIIPMFMSYGLVKKSRGKTMPIFKLYTIEDEYTLKLWLLDFLECFCRMYPIKPEQINAYVLRRQKIPIKTGKGKVPWESIPGYEAIEEAIDINLFKEHRGLERYKGQSDFQMGRYLLYGAIIDMIRFNPECGDMKEIMTEDEQKLWERISKQIRDAGQLLSKKNEMHDGLLWCFIPDRYHRQIDNEWDGIGDWRA